MAAVLEGVAGGADLAAIFLTVCVIALLMGVQSIVHLFTNLLRDITVAGIHIGRPIADAIDGAIEDVLGWARGLLRAELDILDTLLRGLAWSIVETAVTLREAYDAVHGAFHKVFHVWIPTAVHEVRTWALQELNDLSVRIHDLRGDVNSYVRGLQGDIATLDHAVWTRIEGALHGFHEQVINPLAHRIEHIGADVAEVVHPAIDRLEARVRGIAHEVDYGIGVIDDALPRLGDISFDDLNDLMDRIPWRRLGGLITLGFLTHYLVRALTREAGLDRAECRRKVKGICGTDPTAWENLLAGAVGGLALLDLQELVDIARQVIHEVDSEVFDYAERQWH